MLTKEAYVAAVLLSPRGSSRGAAARMEGDEKLRAPGPSLEEGVGAALCPSIEAEQEVVMIPCWSVEWSLVLRGPFL